MALWNPGRELHILWCISGYRAPSLRSGLQKYSSSYTFCDMSFLRFVMLVALIVWIGGIIFFAFVEAPTLFTVLPNPQMAGNVVSPTLSKLHWMGLISGIAFLIASLFYDQQKFARFKMLALSNILVLTMLMLTSISQFGITQRMRELRAQLQTTENLSPTDSRRVEFDRLHEWSTRVEGGVLLCGLAVAALTARRFGSSN
jgi:uncharacterized membrane protein